MNQTLFVSDLDGTLLNKDQQISQQNLAAIRIFRELGGIFTLATGRMEAAVMPFIKELDLDVPVILYNGARIYNPITEEVLYDKHLPLLQELWQQIVSSLTIDVGLFVYRDGQVYTPNRNEIVKKHEEKDQVKCSLLTENMVMDRITKLLLISSDLGLLKAVEQLVHDHGMPNEIVYSEWNYLEILPPNVSKGNALQELLRILSIENAYTMAVGDNLNDISLMESADMGYAVENAHPDLKKMADDITIHHEQHAIAAIIKKYLIEQGVTLNESLEIA
ncbi:Cof-type HAD-IIB family hydrolase [Paenibacillus sp. HWE-109]|uniref:Cof-type HAD-IIB family hydrolase n=1 Tax=Paenibacillus sp. HWE-109 TaxID=1306526 RepID=UPI001EE086C2|nr:Cof-type HAD-IIB family hydrolase [Paenibacillus sp. HWE-109]UKS29425.1 Cof-type HAD-IIB family hydrolase [Paenibacillus sp. HWE-109]